MWEGQGARENGERIGIGWGCADTTSAEGVSGCVCVGGGGGGRGARKERVRIKERVWDRLESTCKVCYYFIRKVKGKREHRKDTYDS